MKDPINRGEKTSRKKNEIKLNKFHQIKRWKKKGNPKKKLRDLERLLNNISIKPKIDEKLRGEKQAEIEKIKGEIEKKEKNTEKNDRKLFFLRKTYDKIKNLERVKLKRKLKRALKAIGLEKDPEKLSGLEREKVEIVDRINYIKFFPKDKKYISLFPKTEIDEKARKMQEDIMLSTKKMLEGLKNKKYGLEKPTVPEDKPSRKETKSDGFFLEPSSLDLPAETSQKPKYFTPISFEGFKGVNRKIVDKRGRIIKPE